MTTTSSVTRNSLDEIGRRHQTDKSSAHHDYLRHYETLIAGMTIPVRSLLEIGVFDGGSLKMWSEFLPETKITGLDLDPRCLAFSTGNTTVEVCDQSNVLHLSSIGSRHGPFDIILDDGSHIWSHQILTFEVLFPFLNAGGAYVIEDLDTSFGHYIKDYGKDSTLSAAQYVCKLSTYLMASTAGDLSSEKDLRMRTFMKVIDSITLIRRSAVIRKRAE